MNLRPFFNRAPKAPTAVENFENCKNREHISTSIILGTGVLRCAKYPDGVTIDSSTYAVPHILQTTAQQLGCKGCELSQETSIAGNMQAEAEAFLAEQAPPSEKQ